MDGLVLQWSHAETTPERTRKMLVGCKPCNSCGSFHRSAGFELFFCCLQAQYLDKRGWRLASLRFKVAMEAAALLSREFGEPLDAEGVAQVRAHPVDQLRVATSLKI